ncbi:MAG: protein kinase [FCB group bacterium]|nr:protein kinase [FCB group bacterium]
MTGRNDDKTRTHTILTKGTMVSHYRIVEKIGAGGMGEVYLAADTQLKRNVALKFLPSHLCQDKDCRARFKREAQAVAKLNYPNIITIHEVAEYQGRPFFAMELVEGQSLRDLAKGKELGIDRIIELAIQIGDGLGAAHEKKVVHRDIKPSNIVIDAYGRPKILDFGLAAVQGGEHLTKTGSTLGTLRYMSPEQVEGKAVDHRSDLFSLGVVLYELISGRTPFEKANEAATLKSIGQDTPEPLQRYKSNIPDELQRTVSKLLEKDPSLRYQHADDVVSDLKRLITPTQSSIIASPTGKISSRLTKVLAPALVVIIALAVLVLKPWQFEISPNQEAIAAENRLAVMYFDNLADPVDSQKLGEIATNLLITDLSESHYVQVVSSQRLYDILKMLGREGEKRIDRTVASQIAERAKAKWMLHGSILRTDPQIVITAELTEVSSGTSVATQRINGEPGQDIFALVDKLTVEIKSDLSLPAEAMSEPDRPVAKVTTRSPEAYRYYLEGVDFGYKQYNTEAKQALQRAVELDSTFAMAYYRLAEMTGLSAKKEYIAKALQYSVNVNDFERLAIEGYHAYANGDIETAIAKGNEILKQYPDNKEAYYNLGILFEFSRDDVSKAIPYYRKAIEVDSLYGTAYNQLAYAYNGIGDYENSIWAISKYIEFAPDEANPYDTRGDFYALYGKLDQAIESFEKALQIKPDFYASRFKLGHMYLFNRDYEKADSSYRTLCSDSNPFRRALGRLYLAYVPMCQGKLDEALRTVDDLVVAGRIEQDEMGEADFHHLRSVIFEEKNELATALTEMERGTEEYFKTHPEEWFFFRHDHIRLLAENKDFRKARLECDIFRDEIEEHDSSAIWCYWHGLGCLEFAQGNYEKSIAHFKEALKGDAFFATRYMLGLSYLKAGNLGEAVSQLDSTQKRYESSRVGSIIWSVKVHYYLGQAYEQSGWNAKAIEQYKTFLDIWKDADEGLKSVDDARERLANLQPGM